MAIKTFATQQMAWYISVHLQEVYLYVQVYLQMHKIMTKGLTRLLDLETRTSTSLLTLVIKHMDTHK